MRGEDAHNAAASSHRSASMV
ncbi:MAG: hypothetical protein QOE78_317, partial [Alphaproteobacteria bacterium]|nr:hypothetical protein [Alphaproteobacteria bacterium]